MDLPDDLARFITSSFRSVWALELLLHLKREARAFSTAELVSSLRASTAVVEQAVASLTAGGLACSEDGSTVYMPVGAGVAQLVDETERLYASKPDRVRRMIIAGSNPGLAAFSDAFRLKD